MLEESAGVVEHVIQSPVIELHDPLAQVAYPAEYDDLDFNPIIQGKLAHQYPNGAVFLPLFRKLSPTVPGERKIEQQIPSGLFPEEVRKRIKALELYTSNRFVIDPYQYSALEAGVMGADTTSGGFGIVVEAYDTIRDKSVKIKFLNIPKLQRHHRPDELIMFVNAFLQEMRVTSKLSQKVAGTTQLCHIPAVIDGGSLDIMTLDGKTCSLPFMVMEKIEGETLHHSSLEKKDLITVISDVAQTLDVVHNCTRTDYGPYGVKHNDVKPSNIIVTPGKRGVLLDFGGASGAYRSQTVIPNTEDATSYTGPLMLEWGIGHTPGFSAPELLNNGIDGVTPESDQHALAMTVYELLVGSLTESWSGEPARVRSGGRIIEIWQHTDPEQKLTFDPALPEPVYDVLEKATSFDYRQRYSDCRAFVRALKAAFVAEGWMDEGTIAVLASHSGETTDIH